MNLKKGQNALSSLFLGQKMKTSSTQWMYQGKHMYRNKRKIYKGTNGTFFV